MESPFDGTLRIMSTINEQYREDFTAYLLEVATGNGWSTAWPARATWEWLLHISGTMIGQLLLRKVGCLFCTRLVFLMPSLCTKCALQVSLALFSCSWLAQFRPTLRTHHYHIAGTGPAESVSEEGAVREGWRNGRVGICTTNATVFDRGVHPFVIPLGLEPKTHSLEGCCSIQLSYGTIRF